MLSTNTINGKHLSLYMCLVVFIFFFFLLSYLTPSAFCKDELNVKRDNEKTVYTIDSKEDQKRDQDRDKDNSWEMLKNIKPWVQTK